MSARTAMLDLVVDPALMSTPDKKMVLIQDIGQKLGSLSLHKQHELIMDKNGTVLFATMDGNLTCLMKLYSEGLVTLTLEERSSGPYLENTVMEDLKKELQKLLENKVDRIPPVKRGAPVPNYYTTSDERLLEYDFDKILFDSMSDYQHVKILHSPTLGNCLFLDDLQNLGDCDLSYTQTLMCHGALSYKDKEVLILGGGDGGLLHELLKEKPAFVTMVDIDSMVLGACQQHLRSVCGNVLDHMKGDNYEIIIGDCLKKMEEYVEEGKTFDYVFNDLTDIPISGSPHTGKLWDFVRKILILALQLVRPDGRYLNHATGPNCTDSLTTYEELLHSLPIKVNFQHRIAYVPSFMEDWVFYEVWKTH